ncbi:MAG: extracellular solute-binding protein [Oscillospiraceae bacterium]|nr:extracellular solute-binding protein [Oscillospiraceae bacterium]
MKSFAKIMALALSLALVFVLAIASSCGDGGTKTSGGDDAKIPDKAEEAGAETDKPADGGLFRDAVPELDFGGYEYKVVTGIYGRENQELFPESEIGEILNDTIYSRNKKIEERLNIIYKADTMDLMQLLSSLSKNVKAGDGVYDMYMQIDRDAYSAAGQSLLHPLDRLPYVDLSQPYWCQLPNKQLTVGGRLYWAFSDDMLSHFEATVVLYFNKKQVQDLGLGDLYGLVRSGAWTHDTMYEFAKLAIKDADGDGKMTEEDYWGFISESDYFYQPFWISAGITLVGKDENDIPYFSVPGNQKFFDMAEKVTDELKSRDGMYLESQKVKLPAYPGNSTEARVAFFRAGHGLFMVGAIQEMVQLRDMPDDFGIIPFPKYAADQPQYYTRVCGGFPYVIPNTCENPELAGALLEIMACDARNMIIPAYYESALKTKYSRDADTAEMLDLIFDTRVYDLGDTIWYNPIRIDYTDVFAKGDNSFASATEKNAEKYAKVIDKAVSAILESGQ